MKIKKYSWGWSIFYNKDKGIISASGSTLLGTLLKMPKLIKHHNEVTNE